MFKLGLYWLPSLTGILLLPFYLFLAPICMVSSSLFDWVTSLLIQQQTITLAVILIFEWATSAFLIFKLIKDRAGKNIFFYEFVVFLVCSNFILIGISYSLLHRHNIVEQFAAKICTSLLLIYVAESTKMKFKIDIEQQCSICCQKMNQECIILKCSHFFHQKCLWQWAYIKQQCPTCKNPLY